MGWIHEYEMAVVVLAKLPIDNKVLVAHQASDGCEDALHVVEIQLLIDAAFEGVGRRCGYRFVMSSL
jgi:hypothetical protein